jgi:hypothetical protein
LLKHIPFTADQLLHSSQPQLLYMPQVHNSTACANTNLLAEPWQQLDELLLTKTLQHCIFGQL